MDDRDWSTLRLPMQDVLEAHAEAIWAELEAVPLDAWIQMPSDEIYQGVWRAFLLEPGPWGHEYPGADFAANRARCPVTTSLLPQLGRVVVAGFLRLEEGTTVAEHQDFRDDDHVRCHLALRMPPEESLRWPVGTSRLMDVRMPHAAANPGPGPRVTMVVDVTAPFVVPTGVLPRWGR
jgi:hypothetical protein